MKRICLILAALALMAALPALASAGSIGEAAQTLAANYKAGRPYAMPTSLVKGLDERGAYEVQGLLVAELLKEGDQVIGIKAGLTSPPAQKKFGAKGPVTGIMLASMLHKGNVVEAKPYQKCMLEVEIGYVLAKDVTSEVTPESVKEYVAQIMPAVEVPDIPFATMKGLAPVDLVASNVGARGYILGKPMDLKGIDVNAVTGKLMMNGKDLGKAVPGRAALGDQWKALAWAINNARAHGGLAKKGMFVITGSLGPLYPGKPGSYQAVYTGGLSEIAFTIK